ncbi:unnamed protein product [Closterium sp. NIES-53]
MLRVLLAAAAVCGWKVEQMDVKTALEALGFKVSWCDESLFTTEEEEEKVFLLVYVDDILLFSPYLERIKEVQGKLKETFQCKALGPVGYYLGLHVERDEVEGLFEASPTQVPCSHGGEVCFTARSCGVCAPSRAPGCTREAGEVLHGILKGGAAIFSAAGAKGSGGGEHKDWCTCKAWALVPLLLHRCNLGK